MLLYEYKVRDEFERIKDLAARIRAKFDAGAEADELLQDCQVLRLAYDHFSRTLPEGVTTGNFGRHLAFMQHHLKRGDRKSCRGDIGDICTFDLPNTERSFRDWCASQRHYDPEFAEKLGDLLLERHLDSAIRKGFVILKERLAKTFELSADLDGRELVNRVFGSKGYLAGKIAEPDRESMRNLLDGLFGVFRNLYGHRDVKPEWHEVEAVLSTINWALKRIDTLTGL